jgi:hypothetical protein
MLRAAAVGGGAYLAGKHRAQRQAEQESQDSGQDQRISNLEQQQDGAAAPAAGAQAAAPSMTDQLNQLGDLHKQGVLNDNEFAAAKSKLLGA